MNVTDVLARIGGGNRQAFAEVVEHFQRPLFGYLGRMGLTAHQAEEIAQETFLRAWVNLADYNPLESLLDRELLEPSDDFVKRVMARVEALPAAARPSRRPTRLEWAAVVGGTLAGIAQLISFLFGLWTAVAAS